MTNDEINRAIAEAMGWHGIRYTDTYGGWQGYKLKSDVFTQPIPNYAGDLNAIASAEQTLTGDKNADDFEHSQLGSYYEQLCFVVGDGQEPLNVYEIDLVRATARHRAEAWLRTKRLWREDLTNQIETGSLCALAEVGCDFLICDGRHVKRADYPQLFAVIGTRYGAQDAETFKLPDLRPEEWMIKI